MQEMMREMQIAESVQMSEKKKKNDAREMKNERNRIKQREVADRNRKKNKIMDWLVRRNMDEETCGEMIYGNSDVAQNLVEVVGGMKQGKLENAKLAIATVGRIESRRGNVGGLGDMGDGEEEG